LEVLALLAAARSNQQIAEELVVALNTVKKHVTHILDKLGAANRTFTSTPRSAANCRNASPRSGFRWFADTEEVKAFNPLVAPNLLAATSALGASGRALPTTADGQG
jgi:Bacterial regulatory proteins, luxR family